MRTKTAKEQAGQVSVVMAFSLLVLVGMVSLGIDVGYAYMTRAQLAAALDSAAVAAARAVTNGNDQAQQTASAQSAAREFFDANFPAGYLGAVPAWVTPRVSFNQGQVTIDVTATATMPNSLTGLLGMSNVTVASTATTVRKDLDLVFVIDSSGSMSPVWTTVKSNANSFLDQFSPTTDRVGLVHFSTGAVSDIAIRTSQRGFDRTAMKTKINSLPSDDYTNYVEGLYQARLQLDSVPTSNRSSLRVVVFFSDGEPNTIAAKFRMDTVTASVTTTTIVTCNKNGKNCRPTDTSSTPTQISNVVPGTTYCTGAVTTTGSNFNSFAGFYDPGKSQSVKLNSPCDQVAKQQGNSQTTGAVGNTAGTYTTTTNTVYSMPSVVPQFYDAHDNNHEFPMLNYSGKTNYLGQLIPAPFDTVNISNNATNVPMEMASLLRSNGTYIFTLGLGGNGGFNEALLKNMANTADANTYNAAQPTGVYCKAATINDLKPCFSKLASEILRITK